MSKEYPTMVGNIFGIKSPTDMVKLFEKLGISASSNDYCVRVNEFDYFKIEFDKGINQVFSDADTPAELIAQASKISKALTAEKVPHEFEVYDESGDKLLAEFTYERS